MSGPKKSFQAKMNWNSATVASAGLASGKMTRQKMVNSFAPSTRPASDSSWGMVMKNCRNKKMLNALPKKGGMSRGYNDPTHPSNLNRMKDGIMITWNGSISVASIRPNRYFFS